MAQSVRAQISDPRLRRRGIQTDPQRRRRPSGHGADKRHEQEQVNDRYRLFSTTLNHRYCCMRLYMRMN